MAAFYSDFLKQFLSGKKIVVNSALLRFDLTTHFLQEWPRLWDLHSFSSRFYRCPANKTAMHCAKLEIEIAIDTKNYRLYFGLRYEELFTPLQPLVLFNRVTRVF